jgi:hypothetical protein
MNDGYIILKQRHNAQEALAGVLDYIKTSLTVEHLTSGVAETRFEQVMKGYYEFRLDVSRQFLNKVCRKYLKNAGENVPVDDEEK